ncbi:four helix bundle protein [Paenibacillus polymyxa]|uniref:four helix bundle protein n=1 Tax=Paenibacillus polymyxa TaxID=1406 RepID=UPI002019A6E4|nr:four helix bundle protein [Paenibacillus polymyxa]UQQ36184.1 four helix bundle protein [Paenibacillus polymyxa]
MTSVGSIISGNDCGKPSIGLEEAKGLIMQGQMKDLFELAWDAYSKNWDHGYAWLNLISGELEPGHERLIDPKNAYLVLMRISEYDYLFEWGNYDELSEFDKYKDKLTIRDWCDLKEIDYREKIKNAVLTDPQRWNEYHQLLDSNFKIILNEWYGKHGILIQKDSEQPKQDYKKERSEQNGKKDNNFLLRDFKKLTLYQKGIELEDMIDKLAESFPQDEKYRLTDQLIRCVTSINANVAESNGGQYAGRERYHLGVAFSSANEVRYWVERAFRRNYIEEAMYKRLDEMAQELRRIMVGMFKRLDSMKGEIT